MNLPPSRWFESYVKSDSSLTHYPEETMRYLFESYVKSDSSLTNKYKHHKSPQFESYVKSDSSLTYCILYLMELSV